MAGQGSNKKGSTNNREQKLAGEGLSRGRFRAVQVGAAAQSSCGETSGRAAAGTWWDGAVQALRSSAALQGDASPRSATSSHSSPNCLH